MHLKIGCRRNLQLGYRLQTDVDYLLLLHYLSKFPIHTHAESNASIAVLMCEGPLFQSLIPHLLSRLPPSLPPLPTNQPRVGSLSHMVHLSPQELVGDKK